MASLLPSSFHDITSLSSSFHGTSQSASFHGPSLASHFAGFSITCSSMQPRNGSQPRAPISNRHIISNYLASPLQMQTPQGEAFLAMANQRLPPVLISQAASQQLELLAAAAEATSSSCEGVTRSDAVLKRRIAEMKQKEIGKALQDIVLALVTHRLMQATLATSDHQQDATVAIQDKPLDDRLRAVHPPDVQPLIDPHVAMAMFGKDHADRPFDSNVLTRVDKLEMGKVYAASVMYGYFLSRVHQRFQLERTLQLEAVSMQRDGFGLGLQSEVVSMESYILGLQSETVAMEAYIQAESDKEAFRRMSSIRCLHTLEVIERHCQALFGEARVHMLRHACRINYFAASTCSSSSSHLTIQLGSMRNLILQALAFGALLWDVEHNFVSPHLHPFN